MVQKSSSVSIILQILLRVILFIIVLGLSLFTPFQVHDLIVNNLGYVKPSGFFGFTLADWEIAHILFATFLVGITFGTLGKKIDYAMILILFCLASFDYYSVENMTSRVYSGLLGAALLGNLIGFLLKLARQKFLPKLKI